MTGDIFEEVVSKPSVLNDVQEEAHKAIDLSIPSNYGRDIPAGLVVFLVALPLCLGIALASGAPLLGGIISGIVGGIIVSFFSGSELSVSGPAAGLTVIVAAAIQSLGSYENFLVAVILSGVLQIGLSYLRAGVLGDFVPSSVIRGMLAAIGIVIILKQIPHAFGRDTDFEGDFSFLEPSGHSNTFSEIARSIVSANPEAVIITIVSFAILLLWEHPRLKNIRLFKTLPAALLVVFLGIGLNEIFHALFNDFYLRAEDGHLVQLPVTSNIPAFIQNLQFPTFAILTETSVYSVAVTLAIVGSLETLLSLEAVDKLDPFRRISDANKELRAQGIGNIISGVLGGLPMTSVIVRSSANVYAGARTRMSAIVHGILLLVSVIFLAPLLNRIPLAALAAILILVGYKLARISLFKQMFQAGKEQFLPFIVTVIAIVFTDLLTGIAIGMCVGMFFVMRSNHQFAVTLVSMDHYYLLRFTKDMTFINKAEIKSKLRQVPNDAVLLIDGTKARFIDADIYDTVAEFAQAATYRNIEIEYKNFSAKEFNPNSSH
ncbi:MAG: SulP family inorganic anion transporter [Candidatus Kapabacteria bacterium]|jgi:MFS superfamily sulfate permease-like transporter|nr:SulP family inorganic anion transporter [Candidatus Kapabacteria bacterium]